MYNTAIIPTLLLILSLQSLLFASEEFSSFESTELDASFSTPNSDYLALKALYLATDGDNWNTVSDWMTASQFLANPTLPVGENIGLWTGVVLSPQGYVQQLNLQSKQLTGQIPPEIGDFCGLEVLNLSFNNLSGSIPPSVLNLTNLRFLYLGVNYLTGNIPVGISELQSLEVLSLKSNDLSGSIPSDISNIDSLTTITLQNNLLTGEIPISLGDLTQLTSLTLQENQLSGRIPSSLGDLNLQTLILNDNDLYGCYDSNLLNLCGQISSGFNLFISDGNKFCISWEDFCNTQVGVCGSTSNDDAYCYCEPILNLTENPEPDRIERASFKISSDDIVDYAVPSTYTAGNQVVLKQGFEVQQGSQLHAYIEACEEDCVVSEPCEGSPCAEVDFELDSEGNKYVPNQLTVIFPSGASSNQDAIRNYLVDIFYFNGFIENSMNLTRQTFWEGTSLEKCLCGHDIYLFTIDPIYIINEEGGGVAANSNGGPMSEGPSYSLNHYIDAGLLNEDAPNVVTNIPTINPNVLNSDTSLTRVAFLDSGVNTDILPVSSLIGSAALESNILSDIGCLNQSAFDTYGWNFVERNEIILDRRGHGTAVYLSYLNALEKLGLQASDQSSLVVKVLNDCGLGTAYDAACGIQYAADRGVDVINMSWGLYTNNLLLQEVIDSVTSKGVLFSCSSGNNGQDLANKKHFPSGYGYPHFKVINPQTGQMALNSIPQIFEVGGLCQAILEPNCLVANEHVNFWSSANYRSGQAIFAEAAIEMQGIVDASITCGIMGTSYAAPQFTAALVNEVNVVGIESVTKSHMFNSSVSWSDAATNFSYYSYILENDQLCN